MFFTLLKGALPCARGALLILCFIFFAASAFAQSSNQELSLEQAFALTLANNPQLFQFSKKREGLLAQKSASELSPAFNLGLEVENFAGSGELSGTSSAETTLAISSVIELGSKRKARVSVADAKIEVLDYQRETYALDVLSELTTVFVKTLEIQELTILADEARDLAQSTLSIVENRVTQGASPEAELKRANAALAQAQLQVDALRAQHQRNRIVLASFWADTSPTWLQLSGDLYRFEQQPEFSDLYQRALSSPAIEEFASETRLKNAELRLAKTQSSLDLNWQIGVRRFEETDDSALVAGISIPLFSRKRNSALITSANAERDEAELRRQSALLLLHVKLFQAYSQRGQHLNIVQIFLSKIIPELSSALASTQRAYETGRYSYQDWIAAQKELFDAKKILIESAASAAINQTIIEQLIAEPLNR